MKKQIIVGTDLEVSRIASGCMNLGKIRGNMNESENKIEAVKSIIEALELGINFFDHADIYAEGKSEEVFSEVWNKIPGLREKIYLQTKCGIRMKGQSDGNDPGRYDFSYEHIINSVNGSLKRLKTDYIDILLLHRPDPLVEPDEVAKAFDELYESGKVRYFGVSNHSGYQIDLLKKSVHFPLVVNQLELNIIHSDLINAGVITNQKYPQFPVRGEGTMEYCRLNDITIQAWSPLALGRLSGNLPEDADEKIKKAVGLVNDMSIEKNVSREAIVIAWLLKHPSKIQPVIGTRNIERIRAACEADSVVLSREEWYTLFIAGRGGALP